MKKATAFAPGHISGFFQPIIDENMDKTGSRGAGVCISHGATSTVQILDDNIQHIEIRVNKKKGRFAVTQNAIQRILEDRPIHITVDVELDLPVGQGFGMSAASTLSTVIALAHLLRKPRSSAIQAAHHAEVTYHTGLGDVASSAIGGFEIRETPGISPYGRIHKITDDHPLLLGLFPGSISTHDVLTNKEQVDRISMIGKECTDKVLCNPTVTTIFDYSFLFTKKTGLATNELLNVLQKINETDHASMCMLGHSFFATGNLQRITSCLPDSATSIETKVDNQGARILNSSEK
jgi:pantoate kinase